MKKREGNVKKELILGGVSALALLASAPGAVAQDAAAAARADATPGEIIVTAQKRSENVQKVPISMTVVGADLLKARNVVELQQLPQLSPALTLQIQPRAVAGISYSIRGVGTSTFEQSVEPTVSTVIDGVSYGRPEMAGGVLFDLDHIEILEGPQGTLFGKNASAGVVSVVTAKPKLDKFEAIGRVSYGQANKPGAGTEASGQLAINIPITSNSAARIGLFATYNSPILKNVNGTSVDNSFQGMAQFGIRAKYLWEASSKFTLLISGDVAQEFGPGVSVSALSSVAPGGFLATQLAATAPQITPSSTNTLIADGAPYQNSFTIAGVQADATLELGGGYSVSNLLAYRSYLTDNTGQIDHIIARTYDGGTQRVKESQVSDELRLLSPTGGMIEFVGGLYFFRANYSTDLTVSVLGEGLPNIPALTPGQGFLGYTRNHRTKLESYAGYVQAIVRPFGPDTPFRLLFGGRYTNDDLDVAGVTGQGNNVRAQLPLGSFNYIAQEDDFSYRIGAQLDLARDVMLYASYTKGYKGPGANPAVQRDASGNVTRTSGLVRPEIPRAFEVGLKSQFFDRRVTLNASAWYETFKDFQAQAFSDYTRGNILLNAGKLVSKGAEVDLTVAPTTGLSLHASLAYVDAYFKKFQGVPCYASQTLGTGGRGVCVATLNPNGSTSFTSDASGNPLFNSSKWTYTLSADYSAPISSSLSGFVQSNWYHRSSFNYSPVLDPNTAQRGYGLLGGALGIKASNDRWKLTLFARNLLDTRFSGWKVANPISALVGDAPGGGGAGAAPNGPKSGDYVVFYTQDSFRTVGLSLDVKF
jgi:iron complex outermembrane receptor protein